MSFALDAITEYGLPVDRARQDKLRTHLESEEARITSDIQRLVPEACRPLNRKTPYKSLPKDLRAALKERELIVKGAKLDYYLVNHYDVVQGLGYTMLSDDLMHDPGLYKRLEFNPNSSDQLLEYIKWQMDNGDMNVHWYIPTHIETGKPTVGKEEFNKLIEETDDELLKLARQVKKAITFKTRYTAGDWIPKTDGRVHGVFRFGTAVQQTSCSGPNIQQFVEHYNPDDPWETDIAEQLKACIRAEPGYKIVNVDMKGFHGRMQGWLAEDPDYYRLASFDLHSFNTAQFVDHPLKDQLRQMNDVDLEAALKSIKKAHGHERNAFVKRVSFLNQYGGGADKASRILSLDILLVEKVLQAIAEPFPRVFKDFPRSVDRRMRERGKLISPHGCTRYFWDLDLKQAVAFSVSNPAHCHIQDALIRLFDRGMFARYGACNFPHDSLWYHCKEELVDECIKVTKEEFEKPSEVLVNSLGPFQCGTDAKVGDSLVEMEEV